MNHDQDYDQDNDQEDLLTVASLQAILKKSFETESELMRNYLMLAERLHGKEDLRNCLQNFAEGNAKRTKQLLDELDKLQ